MKYLKLYEAFTSKGISNTLKFLKDKVGSKESNAFVRDFKQFMAYSDFPIDKISDDNIKYMRAKSALNLRCENKVSNPRELWALKFWFSIEKGYLGFTGTGNKEIEFKSKSSSPTGLKSEERFTEEDLRGIKEKGVKGEIWPVTDYNTLKTGDLVCGFFDHGRYIHKFDVGIAFVDSGGRCYVLQNVSDGSTPEGNWHSFGKRYSWFIYEPDNEMGGDHRCLHYYKETSEELHYVSIEKEKEVEEKEENPLNWNLPLDGLSTKGWNSWFDSISNSEMIKEADFALVLYYDEMTNPDADAAYFEPVSDVKKGRREEKEGAIALMDNEEIKKQNIERYISKLSSNLEISKDDLSNLGKIVIKSLLSEFSLISIYTNKSDNLTKLSYLCNYFYNLMDQPDEESYYIRSIKEYYSTMNKNYYQNLTHSIGCKKIIKGSPFENNFNKIFQIGELISTKIRNKNAQTIDDLLIIQQKLTAIRLLMENDLNRLSSGIRNIIGAFWSENDLKYYIREYSEGGDYNYSESNQKSDLERLERIEKFINSILN